MNRIKRLLGRKGILLTIALTALLAAGCGGGQKEPVKTSEAETSAPAETGTTAETGTEPQELPNPMVEVKDVLAFETIGVHMVLPEGAEDTSFFIINQEVADAQFTLDGVATPTGPRIRQRTLRGFSSALRMRPLHRTMITVKPAWKS